MRIVLFSILLACGIAVVGCGHTEAPAPSPSPSNTSGVTEVRVGNVPSLLFAPLYVAIERGYMKAQGITVDLERVQAGQDAMVFLANGQLDFVLAGYSAGLFNAAARGMDVRVIAPMGIQPQKGDASPLVARASIHGVRDLKGHRIAVPGGEGGAGSFLVALRLQRVGLTLKDVQIVSLGLPDEQAALASGAVDAAQMAEPYATVCLRKKDGVALDPGVLAGVNASGLLTSGAMLNARRDVVRRFLTALMRAARELHENAIPSAQLLPIYAKYTNLSAELLEGTTSYDFSPNFDLSNTKKNLEEMQRIMMAAGVLRLSHPVDVGRIVDPGPAAEVSKPRP